MIKGRVKGQIWSSKHVDKLPKGGYLEVEVESGENIIAYDPLGCAVGEAVLLTQGSVAAGYFTEFKAPIDSLIIGSIDEKE